MELAGPKDSPDGQMGTSTYHGFVLDLSVTENGYWS